jgi:hypothetical protein
MNVVTVYTCQVCGTLSGKPNSVCCASPEPKPFVIDVEAEPQAKPFPDLVNNNAAALPRLEAVREEAKITKVQELNWPITATVFRETFTPDEVERIRKMIAESPNVIPPPKAHWWQRG